jgi:deoxyadenosine/deoxycytidine kinase
MYIVEGNIGAGKSTFLKLLAEKISTITVAQEPVYDWQNKIYGQSLLENFYQQPQRWAYSFETLTLLCRVREHLHLQQQVSVNTLICERSIYSGFYCFAQNSFDSGFLNQLEWSMYCDWFSFLVPASCKPQGFIYLQANPEICYERTKKRNRSAEDTISLDYITQIHRRHEEFLVMHREQFIAVAQVPVLVLDVSKEFENDPAHFALLSKQIQEFIATTQTSILTAQTSPIQHIER